MKSSWIIHNRRSHFIFLLIFLLFLAVAISEADNKSLISSGTLPLSQDEKEWISSHPVVRICPDMNYPPFEMVTPDGTYQGISAELLSHILARAGLRYEVVKQKNWSNCVDFIKNGDADILGAVYITGFRSEYLMYSEPIFSSPLEIITRNTAPSDLTLKDLSGKSVAVVEGYTSHLLLLRNYTDIHPLVVSDVSSGLDKVVFGSADAYLGDLATAAYHVEKSGFSNLQISGRVPASESGFQDLAFGVRKDQPIFVSILNKGLKSMDSAEKKRIISRWIPGTLAPPLISQQALQVIILVMSLFILIIALFIIWTRALRKAVAQKTLLLVHELDERKKVQHELMIKNDELTAAYEQLSTTEAELKKQYYQLSESQKELKEQEQALRQVRLSIDQSHDMMIWLDTSGQIRDVSDSVITTLGYSRTDLLSLDISTIDPSIHIRPGLELSDLNKENPERCETVFFCKNGCTITVEMSLITYEFADKVMFLITARDMSERKLIEELKIKAFTQIDKNIEQFAILNDQIRNPLTLLMIYAEDMEKSEAEKILEQIKRIDQIVDKLDKGLLESEKIREFLRKYYFYIDKNTDNQDT